MVTFYSPTSEMYFHYMTNNDNNTLLEYLSSLSNIVGILPTIIKLKIAHHS